MLNDKQKEALRKWYGRPQILDQARRLIETEQWEELEEHVQMHSLRPLSHHSELPDYLKDEKGDPLIPSNASPMNSREDWEDALMVGWSVIEAELGVSQPRVDRAIKQNEDRTWDEFIRSVEQRKRERGTK